jgi:formate dehydrogenase subunit gamma
MQEVERYKLSTRVLHWIVAASFLVLAITGLFLFAPWFSAAAWWGWSGVAHRVAAAIFVLVPVLFVLFGNWSRSMGFVKEAFAWGKDDVEWFKAAPDYYFGGDPSRMPPQGHINTGQKLYWLTVLVASVILLATGVIMWFFKGIVTAEVIQWSIFLHSLAFIGLGVFFLVHFQLSALHPRMPESLGSMIWGKVSAKYAQSHHGKWYDRTSAGQEAQEA